MSAVPAYKTTSTTAAKPRLRVVARKRNPLGSILLTLGMKFFVIAGIAFFVSSLCGQVMVEKARREGLKAVERSRDARKAEAILRRRLDSLTSLSSISEWAKGNSLIAPDNLVKEKSDAIIH
ncbi:MAG TPA: hypothetical protein VEX38_07270 [Fimbriimonadaceae bacterium]|nr:hypothetical protein [Fimbriimonadaceae bacterium]